MLRKRDSVLQKRLNFGDISLLNVRPSTSDLLRFRVAVCRGAAGWLQAALMVLLSLMCCARRTADAHILHGEYRIVVLFHLLKTSGKHSILLPSMPFHLMAL